MAHNATQPNLLEGIYALGEQLRSALDKDDMDTFFHLVQERGALVERLKTVETTSFTSEELQRGSVSLRDQDAKILATVAVQEKRFASALEKLGRVKHAREHYNQRRAPSRILRRNVRG